MRHVLLDKERHELPVKIVRRSDGANIVVGKDVAWLDDVTGQYEYWDGKRYRVKQEPGGFVIWYSG